MKINSITDISLNDASYIFGACFCATADTLPISSSGYIRSAEECMNWCCVGEGHHAEVEKWGFGENTFDKVSKHMQKCPSHPIGHIINGINKYHLIRALVSPK